MPITVTPLGVRCNLQCGYCYEEPQRGAGNAGGRYDVAKIKAAISAADAKREPFLLFGGEPLLLPNHVLEDLWKWGFERSGKNSLQTNGNLINESHVALFKKYKVNIGVSIDGPGPLNDARWDRTLERTRAATARTEAAIRLLCENGIVPSLIVTLHRLNATGEALDSLFAWFQELRQIGIRRIGLHLLEVENELMRARFEMSVDQTVHAVLRIRAMQREVPGITFTLIDDLENLLLGKDSKSKCIWQACDPYTTPAVRGIGGHGERTKCSRVNKDGVDLAPTSRPGYERYFALYHTPQEDGGCKDCRFFLMCRGQCPGTAIGGDWRNRSEQCPAWKRIFEAIERDLVQEGKKTLSLSPERGQVEAALVNLWACGRSASVERVISHLRQTDRLATE